MSEITTSQYFQTLKELRNSVKLIHDDLNKAINLCEAMHQSSILDNTQSQRSLRDRVIGLRNAMVKSIDLNRKRIIDLNI